MAGQSPNIQLLQASVDAEDESYFRILIDDKFIKYITIEPGLYDTDDLCFGPSFVSLLPPLPPGDWNVGRISLNSATGAGHFASVSRERLPGIKQAWHPLRIDYLELKLGQKLKSNVYEATCPRLSSTFIVKFALFHWEIPQLEKETAAYEWVKDHQIGPEFLGHVTEEGRIIGFIMSRVEDGHHATPDDFDACHLALSELHSLGIKHGDINKHNFLVHGGKAILIDFDFASRNASRDELDDEMRSLSDFLRDASGRGGRVAEPLSGFEENSEV